MKAPNVTVAQIRGVVHVQIEIEVAQQYYQSACEAERNAASVQYTEQVDRHGRTIER